MSELLEAALGYAARGWRVHPLRVSGKEPQTPHGCRDASEDLAQVERWWARDPDANVGIATGRGSGLIVLDVDPRHGGDETLADLERERGRLPETPRAETGGGGEHLYLAHPGGRVPSRAHALGPGLDVKGDGGYVVAPPSLHPCGRRYEWDVEPTGVALALPPEWLASRLRGFEVEAAPFEAGDDDDFLAGLAPAEYVSFLTGEPVAPGGKIRCPLPDHEDRTPSFHVYPTAGQGWYCFGCGRGGGIYQFAALLAGVPLPLRGADFLAVQDALLTVYERRVLNV